MSVLSGLWFPSEPGRGPNAIAQVDMPGQTSSGASEPGVTARLWESDGTREASAAARALESSWREPTTTPGADPWFPETQELQRRVARLLAEAEFSDARVPARDTGESLKK